MSVLKFLFPLSCRTPDLMQFCVSLLVYVGIAFVALLQLTVCRWVGAMGVVPILLAILGVGYAVAGCTILILRFFSSPKKG